MHCRDPAARQHLRDRLLDGEIRRVEQRGIRAHSQWGTRALHIAGVALLECPAKWRAW